MGAMESSPANGRTGGIQPPLFRLPAGTRIGRVRLAVSNLQASLDFYTQVIGLSVRSRLDTGCPNLARLGVEGDHDVLLELQFLPTASPSRHQTRLGLYHVAFLLPSRQALSSFVQHLSAEGVPFAASDHLYSEALYLTDPDGFTVEVYADRPREEWRFEGEELLTGVFPLQISALPQVTAGSWKGAPQGTTVGHIHFFVGDLQKATRFYHRGMGFDLMTWRYPGALFTSANGYHHHVGLNTWAANAPVAMEGEPRLLFWELVLPGAEDILEVRQSLQRETYPTSSFDEHTTVATDPWGINVHLLSAS